MSCTLTKKMLSATPFSVEIARAFLVNSIKFNGVAIFQGGLIRVGADA